MGEWGGQREKENAHLRQLVTHTGAHVHTHTSPEESICNRRTSAQLFSSENCGKTCLVSLGKRDVFHLRVDASFLAERLLTRHRPYSKPARPDVNAVAVNGEEMIVLMSTSALGLDQTGVSGALIYLLLTITDPPPDESGAVSLPCRAFVAAGPTLEDGVILSRVSDPIQGRNPP